MPSCYSVMEYWMDKYITEDGRITDGEGVKVVGNTFLPCCFACSEPVKRKDVLSWNKYDCETKDIWSDKRVNSVLQKAHIVAKQFGGEAVPENLFLLCADCHYESPDTKNKAAFLRWVYRRKKRYAYGIDVVALRDEVKAEIEARGYEVDAFLREYYDLGYSHDYKLVDTAFGGCGLHGTKIVVSSIVASLIDEAERVILSARKQKINEREAELLYKPAI